MPESLEFGLIRSSPRLPCCSFHSLVVASTLALMSPITKCKLCFGILSITLLSQLQDLSQSLCSSVRKHLCMIDIFRNLVWNLAYRICWLITPQLKCDFPKKSVMVNAIQFVFSLSHKWFSFQWVQRQVPTFYLYQGS